MRLNDMPRVTVPVDHPSRARACAALYDEYREINRQAELAIIEQAANVAEPPSLSSEKEGTCHADGLRSEHRD